jgi:hypothetical protein
MMIHLRILHTPGQRLFSAPAKISFNTSCLFAMAGSPRLLHHGVVANRGFDRIYRLYEIVAVHGTPIKELIHEEFGDGIMSAIDFSMDISREPDPKGATGSKSSCRVSSCRIKLIEHHGR